MDSRDRHALRAPDVHDLEPAGGDQLVRRRPADTEHRRRLDDRQKAIPESATRLVNAFSADSRTRVTDLPLSQSERRAVSAASKMGGVPDELPDFRYHPDPVATGSVVASGTSCRCCGRARGFIYTGPVCAVEELVDELCPWCVHDGSAASMFDADFTDVGWGVPEDVPRHVLVQIAKHTPGFAGWQQERWLYHCGDAAAFLGRAGFAELRGHEDALEAIRDENSGFNWSVDQIESYLQNLHVDGDATAYLFRCLHCGRYLAYSDMS